MFVGEDRQLGAASVQLFEQFASPGVELHVVEHRRVPVRLINRAGFGDAPGPGEPGDRVVESAAHGRAHLGGGRLGQAELAQGVGMGALDGGELVDQRAVEVEKEGGERRHGMNEIWFGDEACHE